VNVQERVFLTRCPCDAAGPSAALSHTSVPSNRSMSTHKAPYSGKLRATSRELHGEGAHSARPRTFHMPEPAVGTPAAIPEASDEEDSCSVDGGAVEASIALTLPLPNALSMGGSSSAEAHSRSAAASGSAAESISVAWHSNGAAASSGIVAVRSGASTQRGTPSCYTAPRARAPGAEDAATAELRGDSGARSDAITARGARHARANSASVTLDLVASSGSATTAQPPAAGGAPRCSQQHGRPDFDAIMAEAEAAAIEAGQTRVALLVRGSAQVVRTSLRAALARRAVRFDAHYETLGL
jgi:hypothetical protein